MVKREVEKQVPVGDDCNPCKKRKHGLFGR
jgi:hypothetical protein